MYRAGEEPREQVQLQVETLLGTSRLPGKSGSEHSKHGSITKLGRFLAERKHFGGYG